jgi:hypothetical protein
VRAVINKINSDVAGGFCGFNCLAKINIIAI